MRLLCASNLHLGRRPAGLHTGVDPARLSAAATWTRLVDAAIAHRADAILLAGDTIDRENPSFEPAGALRQGLGTLERENIPVIAIAGDEDAATLPRVARLLQSPILHLLDDDHPSIDIGPDTDRVTVIAAEIPEAATPDRTIGLLHASLTDGHAPDGTVNPVRPDDLASRPAALWVLGAQREPDVVIHGNTTIIEPGAAWPATPDETGPHGAILVDVDGDEGHVTCDLIPLAPVQFADIDLDLTGTDDLDATESAIVEALTTALDDALRTDTDRSLAALVCTVHLTGATPRHAGIPALADDLARTLAVQRDGVVATIGEVEIDTRPELDIGPLLNRPDPVGELARLLHALEGDDGEGEPSPAHAALIQRATDRLVTVHRSRIFAGVAHDAPPDADLARATLRREAWNVLDALVRQRGID